MSNEQAPECCPFCGAKKRGFAGKTTLYECNSFVSGYKPYSKQSAMCEQSVATAERERLTRERDGLKEAHTNALNQIGDLCMENANLIACVKRLEEAGDAIVDHNIGCGCGQDGPCRACRMACEAWTKAKEATP